MLALIMTMMLWGCQTFHIQPPPTSQLSAQSDKPVDSSTAKSGGRLAYIGADGNVYITTARRTATITVTNDATAPWEGQGLSYQRITWSSQGQLAYAAVTRTGDTATSKLYVADSPGEPARIVGQSSEHFVIYIYWSPVSCLGQSACRQLAYLTEESEDIALRLVKMDGDTVENEVIGLGWPYYFSWAVDGESILGHTGGAYQQNSNAQLVLHNLDGGNRRALSQKPANFMAPAWSPGGDVWLGVLAGERADQLQLFGPELPLTLATVPEGGAAFVWSPTGNQVAYTLKESSNDQFYGPLHIFDMSTGQSRRITAKGLRSLAFFCDPTGQRI